MRNALITEAPAAIDNFKAFSVASARAEHHGSPRDPVPRPVGGGGSSTVVLLALAKPARWYVSDAIESEHALVLARPELKIRRSLRLQLLQLIENHTRVVKPSRLRQVSSDPADNMFVECADAATANAGIHRVNRILTITRAPSFRSEPPATLRAFESVKVDAADFKTHLFHKEAQSRSIAPPVPRRMGECALGRRGMPQFFANRRRDS